MSIEGRKQSLRSQLLKRRRQAELDNPGAALAAMDRFPARFRPQPGGVIAGYRPLGSEIDPTPLMQLLAANGLRLALPVVVAEDQPLEFRAWDGHGALEEGPFGIEVPGPDAEVLVPDLLLVPLLAVDETGMRMGYGKGFYDRTLAALRASGPIKAVGMAFDQQIIKHVPRAAHDQPLDALLTPTGCREFRHAVSGKAAR
ncbi:5-formyltetrahydrofolate cyclo-ligase [Maricaulis sp. CAU 1757]